MLGDATLKMRASDLEVSEALSVQHSRPPATVPGYTPQRLLGHGAYGEVWVAVDQNTGRKVAIKFYAHRGGLDWSLLSREVEKLTFLFNDRFVVQLLEVGWDSDPPYYVMEFLDNGSLEQYLQAGPLPSLESQRLFRDIVQGLINSHNKGVLHCDLKPANILLDDDWRPRLADFGQSRLSTEQTPTLGTLFYMAPEQADLNAAPDARWDVYALGAIFYRMLTGKPPYYDPALVDRMNEAPDLATRLEIYRHAIQMARRPKAHRKIRGVDRILGDIIDRCLARDPQKRYPNPQVVLDALNARALARARQPLLVLGGIGPLVLLLVISVVGWSGFRATVEATTVALRDRANLSNAFAARFVAETVARQIDRRWVILEREAIDAELRADLSAPENTANVKDIQQWLDERRAEYEPTAVAASWFITDADGNQLARSPYSADSIGNNYSWRDYFHGKGRDLPKGTPDLEPITDVHLSPVFTSEANRQRMVAFSVPVWSGRVGTPDRRVLGVLAMTVAIGQFGEIEDEAANSQVPLDHKETVLADLRPDATGEPGLILQHPGLGDSAGSTETLPTYRLDEETLTRLKNLESPAGILISDYVDPVGGKFAGEWVAAAEPVLLKNRPGSVGSTGWVVLVQEKFADIARPVDELARSLIQRAAIAMIIVVATITALWGLVVAVVNGSSRSRVAVALRRRAGLMPDTLSVSGMGSARLAGGSVSDSTVNLAPGEESSG